MAEITKEKCSNCGAEGLLFCDNEFTDFLCRSCGATNLRATLAKLETVMPCKNSERHDMRIAKGGKIFCPLCWTEFGIIKVVKSG
jgi:predicted RNA-binding Zn-ribbon protein involved in translation (DUF1610 family)